MTFTGDGFYRGASLPMMRPWTRAIGEFPRSSSRRAGLQHSTGSGNDPMKVMLVMSEVHSDNWGR